MKVIVPPLRAFSLATTPFRVANATARVPAAVHAEHSTRVAAIAPARAAGSTSLDPSLSAFLDAMRIAAALTVFSFHWSTFWWPALFYRLAPLAHGAVVVFFVLSGFLISHAVAKRETDWRSYGAARLSRLYSVILPALVLTALLQLSGQALSPSFYRDLGRGWDVLRYLLSSCFLQNAWFLSASPPSNNPLWSLSYEFWYYVLFGVGRFIPSRSIRAAAWLAIGILVGPNILLLMPCWLLGVAIHRVRRWSMVPLERSGILLGVTLLTIALAAELLPAFPFDLSNKRLLYSGAFLTDWSLALLVALAILCFQARRFGPPPAWLCGLIRHGADRTFSLYLFHYPIIVFASALLPSCPRPGMVGVGVAAFTLVAVYGLGGLVESRGARWRLLVASAVGRAVHDRGPIGRPSSSMSR